MIFIGAIHRIVSPTLIGFWIKNNTLHTTQTRSLKDTPILQIILNLQLPTELSMIAGAPNQIWVLIDVFPGNILNFTLQLFKKTPTRLPESMFFRFIPPISSSNFWKMTKLGESMDPSNVIVGGNKRMHTISNSIAYTNVRSSLTIQPLDAPLVVFGEPTAFPTPTDEMPDFSQGASFILWDNIWNTNYPLWYPFNPEDCNLQFRFRLTFE